MPMSELNLEYYDNEGLIFTLNGSYWAPLSFIFTIGETDMIGILICVMPLSSGGTYDSFEGNSRVSLTDSLTRGVKIIMECLWTYTFDIRVKGRRFS